MPADASARDCPGHRRTATWLALMGFGFAGSGCPAPATTCEQDSDCPAGYFCHSDGRVCALSVLPVDARATDAADGGAIDTAARDREPFDVAQLDRTGSDSALPDRGGLDATADRVSMDRSTADRAATDAPARDRDLTDQVGPDQHIDDARRPDQRSADSGSPGDANPCQSSECWISGMCEQSGDRAPDGCEYCDPTSQPFAWRARLDGTQCQPYNWNMQCCGGQCRDLASDTAHCGWCFNGCVLGCEYTRCCGETGQSCCSGATCSDGLACLTFASGVTACDLDCGSTDQRCCAGNNCLPGLACDTNQNRCEACGSNGALCCYGNTCDPALVCDYGGYPNRCAECGDSGELCCADSTCHTGFVCGASYPYKCEPCGGTGQRCCVSAPYCNPSGADSCIALSNGTSRCYANCGAEGETCCGGTLCRPDTVCDANSGSLCVACGQRDEPCCDGAAACAAWWLTCGSTGHCSCGFAYQRCCDGTTCDQGTCVATWCQ